MGLPRYLENKWDNWVDYINKYNSLPLDLYFVVEDYFVKGGEFNYRKVKPQMKTQMILLHAIKRKYKLLKIDNSSDIDLDQEIIVGEFVKISNGPDQFQFENQYIADIEDLLYKWKNVIYKSKEYMLGILGMEHPCIFNSLYKERKIKRKFASIIDKKNAKNYLEHLTLYTVNQKLYEYKYWKKTDSRTYKGTLRQLVFERDNYTCQCCGITNKQAFKKGLMMEVDHIIEWEDGGETTYENGQVLCSECNKAKHKSKKLKLAV